LTVGEEAGISDEVITSAVRNLFSVLVIVDTVPMCLSTVRRRRVILALDSASLGR
jgi:hypothetical protein